MSFDCTQDVSEMNLENARIELAIVSDALASDDMPEDECAAVYHYYDTCCRRVAFLEGR